MCISNDLLGSGSEIERIRMIYPPGIPRFVENPP